MIKIGLCDDNILHLKELSDMLQTVAKKNNFKLVLDCFSSGNDLINFYTNHNDYYDILFLDILLDEANGIDIAKTIRSQDCNAYIIFGTISKDYALESYSVDAYKYILKPYVYDFIEQLVLELIHKIELNKKNTIYIKNNQDIYTLKLESVIYFESNLRKIIAHLSNGDTITFYNKMSDFEKEINSNMFVRCHRSFLVNLLYLKNVIGTDIVTLNNKLIPISKKYLLTTRETFTNFIKSKL